MAKNVLLCDPNDSRGDHPDLQRSRGYCRRDPGTDRGNFGRMPILAAFLSSLRDLTTQAGAMLIFDEVVTGFRVSPGGVQAALGVTPDMTTLAK